MCANDAIDFSCCEASNNFFGLCGCKEPRYHLDANWITSKAITKCVSVLRSEQCCRNKDRNLFAVLYALECGTHCNFGFAKTNIATHKTIHRHASFHVCFDQINCGALIGCFNKGECAFHFVLPWRVLRKSMTNGIHSALIEHHEFLSDLAHRRTNTLF